MSWLVDINAIADAVAERLKPALAGLQNEQQAIIGKFLRIKTAAALYDFDEKTLRGYCCAGKIPGAVRVGKEWRIPVDAIDMMLEQGFKQRRVKG